jgi:hypothetical protein
VARGTGFRQAQPEGFDKLNLKVPHIRLLRWNQKAPVLMTEAAPNAAAKAATWL